MPRYVLTGPPGAGKTSVLRRLDHAGVRVVEEAATDVIAVEQALGNDRPWTDPAFIDKIVHLQRRRQNDAADGGTVVFDRSPVCTLALSRFLGFPTSSALADELYRIRRDDVYEPVAFLIRNLGVIQPTAARQIGFADSLDFERIHEETYRQLGFRLVDVPAGPVRGRAAAVQQVVQQQHAW